MPHLDFFFDLSSPWTYLAFRNVQPIVAETGAGITYRPFLVGAVFNAVNQSVYASREAPDAPKNLHYFKVLNEWADLAGVEMHFPSAHHPLKSVLAMRVCCALEDDQAVLARFAEAAFRAYFGEEQNLDDPEVTARVADGCGLDGAALIAAAGTDAVKARLRANTDEAIARGAYGSPTIFIGEHMYFGNDQLPLVRRRLEMERS
jgi:2-hydroxychromene-2-carboxylate isomerase